MKNFNIFGVHRKIQFLGGGGSQKANREGGLPKKRGLGQFADLREGGLARRGVLVPQWTLCGRISFANLRFLEFQVTFTDLFIHFKRVSHQQWSSVRLQSVLLFSLNALMVFPVIFNFLRLR